MLNELISVLSWNIISKTGLFVIIAKQQLNISLDRGAIIVLGEPDHAIILSE